MSKNEWEKWKFITTVKNRCTHYLSILWFILLNFSAGNLWENGMFDWFHSESEQKKPRINKPFEEKNWARPKNKFNLF